MRNAAKAARFRKKRPIIQAEAAGSREVSAILTLWSRL